MKRLEKISIITVCLNSEKTIEKTIKSVIKQTYKNIEYIIVDGKSSDKTLKIVRKYRHKIAKIISQKDKGVYDAMNKGILVSSGEILFFLNSDDYFYNSRIVEKIMIKFVQHPSLSFIYGDSIFAQNKEKIDNSHKITRRYLLDRTIHHQSIFVKKNIFEKKGLFSGKYRIASDYEWVLKVFNRPEIKKLYLKRYITVANKFGLSGRVDYKDERKEIRKNYFNVFEIWFYQFINLCEKIMIKIFFK